jgi:hypothetical protein
MKNIFLKKEVYSWSRYQHSTARGNANPTGSSDSEQSDFENLGTASFKDIF